MVIARRIPASGLPAHVEDPDIRRDLHYLDDRIAEVEAGMGAGGGGVGVTAAMSRSAIQAVLDANDDVTFAAGTYATGTTGFAFHSGQTLRGPATAVIQKSGAGGVLKPAAAAVNVTVLGLTLDNTASATAGGIGLDGTGLDRLVVVGTRVTRAATGIKVDGAADLVAPDLEDTVTAIAVATGTAHIARPSVKTATTGVSVAAAASGVVIVSPRYTAVTTKVADASGKLTVIEAGGLSTSRLVGLGTQDIEDWAGAAVSATHVGATGALACNAGGTFWILNNAYMDAAAVWRYRSAGAASMIRQSAGGIRIFTAVAGAADAALVWVSGVLISKAPTAFTQTYATADPTLDAYAPNAQNVAYTGTALGEGVAYVGVPGALGDAATRADLNDLRGKVTATVASLTEANALRVATENLRALTEDLAQFVNAFVDFFQARGDVS